MDNTIAFDTENEELLVTVNGYENRFPYIFQDVFRTINVKTGEIGVLKVKYIIFNNSKDFSINNLYKKDIEKIDSNASEDKLYVLAYNENKKREYVYKQYPKKDILAAFSNSYASGTFVKNNIYIFFKELGYMICDRSTDTYILKDLLMNSNSIIYRNNTPIVVVDEAQDKNSFFELTKYNEYQENPNIIMNFFSQDNFSSIYDDPVKELFNLTEDKFSRATIKATANNNSYFLILKNKDANKELLFTLSLDNGQTFKIDNVEIVDDYKNTKSIIDNNYNDKAGILNNLLDYNTDRHFGDMFSLID